jgi:hypothetical protein
MLSDNEDKMVALLEQIAANTGLDDAGSSAAPPTGSTGRTGSVRPWDYVVVETASMSYSNPSGTVTLSPGDSVNLVDYEATQDTLLAIGATDKQDVEYELTIDKTTVGGRTNSPLGLVNEPFSFVDALAREIPVEKRLRYTAHYDPNASGDIELAGRIHVDTSGVPQ